MLHRTQYGRQFIFALGLLTLSGLSHAIVTTLSPADPIYNAASYTGVARLSISIPNTGNFGCSGSLLSDRLHILTAAHCVTDHNGNFISGTTVNSNFGAFGNIFSNQIFVHPTFNLGTFAGDLAIIRLSSALLGPDAYSLYTRTNEVGQIGDIVGFGQSGTGLTGATLPSGTRRYGQNRVDALLNISNMLDPLGIFLLFDFDDGTTQHDALGWAYGLNDLGVGNLEVNTAPGDSGGPTFINGLLAGVTSFGSCFANNQGCLVPPDVDTQLNSSFGELFGNTRVSSYASWINSFLTPQALPAPGSYALLGIGLFALISVRSQAKAA